MTELPPNMNQEEYDLLKNYRERIPELTGPELLELRRLNDLSISHLQFNYPAKRKPKHGTA